MIEDILYDIEKEYKKKDRPIIQSERCQWSRENETLGESKARRSGFLSGLLVAKSFVEKQNGLYPNYKDLLYKYDSLTTEMQDIDKYKNALNEIIAILEIDYVQNRNYKSIDVVNHLKVLWNIIEKYKIKESE